MVIRLFQRRKKECGQMPALPYCDSYSSSFQVSPHVLSLNDEKPLKSSQTFSFESNSISPSPISVLKFPLELLSKEHSDANLNTTILGLI